MASHERGEWFYPSTLVMSALKMMKPWGPHPKSERDLHLYRRRYPESLLAVWLDETNTRQHALAAAVGCSPPNITRILKGESPSLDLAIRIERVTAGKVSPADFLQRSEEVSRPQSPLPGIIA
jgi:transcriptional regulator with XRE-family HTH domain